MDEWKYNELKAKLAKSQKKQDEDEDTREMDRERSMERTQRSIETGGT